MFQLPDDPTTWLQMLLRYIHFLAGITWIGLLYFFNLVNGAAMKALDPATRGKVVPVLMPRALNYFRWGALVTWLSGFSYFAWIIIGEHGSHSALLVWLVVWVVAWGIIYALLQPVSGVLDKGIVIGVIVTLLAAVMGVALLYGVGDGLMSSRSKSIAMGGGLGTIMLFNVWGIIWPHQKRIIAWTRDSSEKGTPMPPEAAKMARRALLASRMNTWLSIPMLWFMGAASHFPMFGAGG